MMPMPMLLLMMIHWKYDSQQQVPTYVHTMCYLKGVPNECKLVMLYCRLCEYAL